jgi:quercetin dioxygenase-like cupin family protein
MTLRSIGGRLGRSGALMAGATAAVMLLSVGAASAGQCPADKVVASGTGQQPGATMPVGVKDTVLGMIDLAKEPSQIADRKFRLRRLEIQPGGEVPWHSHADRPAIIYMVAGSITEYSSECAVPIVHVQGDVSVESAGVSHWWKNSRDTVAVLISADLLADPADEHMM